jgi:hypothetical protein
LRRSVGPISDAPAIVDPKRTSPPSGGLFVWRALFARGFVRRDRQSGETARSGVPALARHDGIRRDRFARAARSTNDRHE